ncbi:MAG: DUF7695 domain-containing protein [Acidimicrobiales bacterium]
MRCDACGGVIESAHPWDTSGCACGRLSIGGGPRRPWLRWSATAGSGWTDLGGAYGAAADRHPRKNKAAQPVVHQKRA